MLGLLKFYIGQAGENLTVKVIFELRPKGSEGTNILAEERTSAKSLWQE